MERVNNTNETSRKKILKKAALLATAASITGAVTVGGQKPKESDALIGLIVTLVTTVVSVGAGIAQTAVSADQQWRAEEAAKKQAEEEARQAKIREQLENSSEHNVRVNQEAEEETGKEIDISIANNADLVNQGSQGSRSNGVKTNSGKLNKPPAPPKGIQVGGFGVEDEVEEEEVVENISEEVEENVELNEEVDNTEKQDEVKDVTNETKPPVIHTTTGETTQTNGNNKVENTTQNTTNRIESNKQETQNKKPQNSLKDHTNKTGNSTTPKFELSFEENSNDLSDEENVVYEDLVAHGVGVVGEFLSEDAVEFDESMVMDEETALNHRLVQEGYLTSEELILYDYGIRVGAIDENILNTMYENGEISDESYAGAIELMYEIYEEFYGEE